jgi:hypothetical protein
LRHEERGYCCLGVLCDILPDVTWEKEKESDSTYHARFGELNVGVDASAALPYQIARELGVDEWCSFERTPEFLEAVAGKVTDATMRLLKRPFGCGLASINDQGASFEEIAIIIENAPFHQPAETAE